MSERYAGGPVEPQMVVPKTSGMAIAALVLGILGFFTCGISAIVGLILGIVALGKIKGSGGTIKGTGMATAGIVLSGIGLVLPFIAIMAGMLLPALGRARDEARKVRCQSNLNQIAKGTQMWLLKFGDSSYYPPSLQSLVKDGVILEPKVFLCPGRNTQPTGSEFTTDYECILDLVGRKVTEAQTPNSTPLAWDKKGNHYDGRCVVFADSHVEFVTEDAFQSRVLPRIQEWVQEMKRKAP